MNRFAVFAILGPCLAGMTMLLLVLPGWFVAIGLFGGIPALICSWVTLKLSQRQSVNA
jgi:hypothetical protein